jgi:hypothetical protein
MTEQPNWKFTIPEETPTLEIHQPNWYKVDVEKLHYQRMEDVAYLFATMMVSEDYEHFDKVKKYLIIPEKPKSIEELQQELDEKFEKLIERTHLEYRIGHNWTYKLRKYDEFCKRQDADFEYARENGFFSPKLTVSVGKLDYSNLVATSSSVSWGTEFRIGKDEVGYFSIKPNIRVYLEKKPNPIVRYFSKLLLDFTWKDK